MLGWNPDHGAAIFLTEFQDGVSNSGRILRLSRQRDQGNEPPLEMF